MEKEKKYQTSKLGMLLKERGITQREFAQMLFEKSGYLIHTTNLSNLCTGFRSIKKIQTAQKFADVLNVSINEIL
jgi:transcriptional regulator with XRE-family HTH domain